MKSFICQMFYKQRAAFEQSYASRGREYPLPEEDTLCPWKRSFARMPPAAYRTFDI